MFGKAKKTKEKIVADNYLVGLDIGTEFVKALIARVEGETLEIVGVGRCRQAVGDMYAGAIADIKSVVKNCEAALAEAEEMADMRAEKVVIGLAGELVKGNTTTIKYRRAQPKTPLDESEMEFIIDKVQAKAGEKARKEVALETGNEDVEVKLVNSALVSIHIDGYKVSNPIGFQGKDVAVQIYTAYAPMVHIGAIEKVCDELGVDLIAVAAEPFAVSRSVIGMDTGSNFTAILMDIGGGTTDVAVVDDGGVEGTKMFGIGGRAFTHQIEAALDLGYEAAEKLKIEQDNEQVKPRYQEKIKEAIDRTAATWISGVELALEEFKNVDHLPGKILLCGGGASLPQIMEMLGTDWWKELPFARKPKVQLVNAEEVAGVEDMTDSDLDHTFVTVMGLLRVGYDTISGIKRDDSLKDKLTKVLRT